MGFSFSTDTSKRIALAHLISATPIVAQAVIDTPSERLLELTSGYSAASFVPNGGVAQPVRATVS